MIKKSTRNSNVELLRILSMFLIVLGHVYATRFDSDTAPIVTWYQNTFFGTWSILGVNLFVVISAWFLSEQTFSTKRIISVLFEAVFYILAFAICYAVIECSAGFSVRTFFGSLVYYFAHNFFSEYHWFVIAYIALCFISPFLNILSAHLQKRQFFVLISVLAVISFFTNIYGAGYYSVYANIFNFCFIYLLTVYFKNHAQSARVGIFCILLPVLFIGFRIIAHYLPDNELGTLAKQFLTTTIANSRRYSLVMVFLALFIFLIVVRKPARTNSFVNTISRHVFGVYLFHETYFTTIVINGKTRIASLKDMVVDMFARNELLGEDWLLCLKLFGIAVLIFVAGIIFEFIRYHLVQKPVMGLITRKLGNRLEKADSCFSSNEGE